jgi:hypothetical protein
MKAQDTPDNSLFSFKIRDPPKEDDAQSTLLTLSELLEDAKAKLQTMLILIDQNIEQLVHDAGPIRDLLLKIRGHHPEIDRSPHPCSLHREPTIQGFEGQATTSRSISSRANI